MSKKENIKLPIIFWLSIIASIVATSINIFRWSLIEILTPFLEPMLELAIYGFFLIIIIWSFIFGLMKMKSQKIKAFIPIIINIAAVIIIFVVPFTAITTKMDFYFHINEREDVIEKITNGELISNVSYNDSLINLPAKYKNLSKGGGNIVVEYENKNPNVFFFTFRGVIDNFSGFAYMSDGNEPERNDFLCTQILEVEKLKDHWFWLACT
jgi:hypothetical protein